MEEGWAQLVSTTDLESDPVLLTKDKFIIGRLKTGTDLSLPDNRLVSAVHCVIERDSAGGVWIEDKRQGISCYLIN
ncbi:hypothetical protein NP493_1201g01039 [Ridgeia piscesae]|uniref:FHA domain-containing protein n=1 Tax=Ridgeia piscesae TaxID=27915 RepID=A0AAD9NJ98_RIDPI|nr:hypothetical protein NP493_1201g01039 [Ridgeia piscesae]